MAVIVRDDELERLLEAERQRKFGDKGTKARVLRDIARDHFTRREVVGELAGRSDPQPAALAG